MDIRLRRMWFAPDISGNTSNKYVSKAGRVIARGHRLRRGVHLNLPDEWRDRLPSDAVVLKEPEDYQLADDERKYEPAVSEANPAADDRAQADINRTAMEFRHRLEEDAEAEKAVQLREQRIQNLAKAREAKKEKKDNA